MIFNKKIERSTVLSIHSIYIFLFVLKIITLEHLSNFPYTFCLFYRFIIDL